MAALTDDTPLIIDERMPLIWGFFTAEIDTFFRGAIVCWDTTNDTVTALNANADQFHGVVLERKTTVAGDLLVKVATMGRFLFTGAVLIDSSVGQVCHPLATSDNPADVVLALITLGGSAANPSAVGMIDQITDNAGTTGWVNTGIRSTQNTA